MTEQLDDKKVIGFGEIVEEFLTEWFRIHGSTKSATSDPLFDGYLDARHHFVQALIRRNDSVDLYSKAMEAQTSYVEAVQALTDHTAEMKNMIGKAV